MRIFGKIIIGGMVIFMLGTFITGALLGYIWENGSLESWNMVRNLHACFSFLFFLVLLVHIWKSIKISLNKMSFSLWI